MSRRTITIAPTKVLQDGNDWIASSRITADEQHFDVWYRCNRGPVTRGIEPFVAASVLPAMKLGYAIHSTVPISARLHAGIAQFQKRMCLWHPVLHQIPIHAETDASVKDQGMQSGSFFSCGVDACYTLLKHYEEVSAAILIHGFDYRCNKTLIKSTVSSQARMAATKLQRPLIEVETNIRDFGDLFADWGTQYHGSVLASVGLFLAPQFNKLFIPSSYYVDDLFPWGSHPELDPLWSTESLQFIHDGCDVTRSQKVSRIGQSDAALSVLRVCWSDYTKEGRQLNCGKCEKCIRTMIDLRIAGVLHRCKTFRSSLKLEDVSLIDMRKGKHRSFYTGSLHNLLVNGNDPELAQALDDCLSGRHYQGLEGVYRDVSNRLYRKVLRPLLRPIERTARYLSRSTKKSA